MPKTQGFTLIDLLVVAAIIAIMAAIAIPNFTQAETRSKIARVKNDMRSLSVAMESYRVDLKKYPCRTTQNPTMGYGAGWCGADAYVEYLIGLTSPVPYIPSVRLRDPFIYMKYSGVYPRDFCGSYTFVQYSDANGPARSWGAMMRTAGGYKCIPNIEGYVVSSCGVDRLPSGIEYACFDVGSGWNLPQPWPVKVWGFPPSVYDPTNGIVSSGDIGRFGGAMPATSTP